jgi:hypothetical protein
VTAEAANHTHHFAQAGGLGWRQRAVDTNVQRFDLFFGKDLSACDVGLYPRQVADVHQPHCDDAKHSEIAGESLASLKQTASTLHPDFNTLCHVSMPHL